MAATNFTPIQLYHSTTASAVPVNTNLVDGELAINIADGKLYYKDSGGTVQVIASKATGTIGGSTTQVQYNSSGALAGSANFTFNGTTATINTLNLTNALGAAYGGTAQSTYTQGDLLYASAANTLAKLAIGSNTYILTSNGTIPGWAAPSSISVNTATNLAGGAGGSVPYQSGAGATTFLSIGTANQVMTSSGSLPQWSSGLSITTLTASDAVTFSATTQNIALGTSQTTGTFTVGGAAQTGALTLDQSTKTHTLNLGTGATESGLTKTINLGTGGVSTSTTAINIGSANGTTISLAANPTLSAGTANGVVYLNASKVATSGSALTYDGSYFTAASGTGAFFADIMQVSGTATKVNANGVGLEFRGGATPNITSYSRVGSAYLPVTLDALTSTFSISGTERMRLNSTSLNIGGNFTSTNNTLQVTGNAAIGDTLAGPTDGLYVKGNVGIGTNSPQGPLEVAATGATVNQFLTGGTGNNAVTGIFRIGSGSGRGASIQGFRGVSSNVHSLDFYSYNAADVFGMRLDSSGNLGIGQTNPSTWLVNGLGIGSGANDWGATIYTGTASTGYLCFADGATGLDRYRGYISYAHATNAMIFATDAAERMRIDASGRLFVGNTTAPGSGEIKQVLSRAGNTFLEFQNSTTNTGCTIGTINENFIIFTNTGALGSETYTERARITSGGYFKASNNGNYDNSSGTYHEFYQTANSNCLYLRATNASYTSSVLGVVGDRTTTNGTYNLVNVFNGNSTGQFIVRDSGNAINTNGSYGTISDQRLKQDIVDAGSQWEDLKAIRFRKYRMKADVAANPDAPTMLGVVAQELEQTSPGLVETTADRDAEGNDLGTTTKSVKTSVLLMKAAVALQEAMARIEKLEAEVAALKGV